ncbi:hypothetical protein K501DRAFT_338527 [Backusella circina FSU 941]|nr:hypothetical protein K501DRAFT_338527 [Backusella circina FSU 941]
MTMISSQKNKETRRKEHNRPDLTIDTNFERNKKKAWHQLLIGKDKTKSESNSPDLPTPPHTASPDGSITNQNIHFRTQSSEELNGVQLAFRKLHVRSLNKIRSSTDATSYFDHVVVPDAPEPIIPSVSEWTPETSLTSPPPWEYLQNHIYTSSNHNYHGLSNKEKRMGRLYTDVDIVKLNRKATIRSVDQSFAPSIHSSNSTPDISRRKSCPGDYDITSDSTTLINDTAHSHSFSEKDIIVITEEHTRHMSVLKKYTPPVNKNPVFKGCRKVKAQAAEMAAQGNPIHLSHSSGLYSTICEDYLKNIFIPTVFDPYTHQPIVDFLAIQPRKFQLQRKMSWKREAKALNIWQQTLKKSIDNPITTDSTISFIDKLYARKETSQFTLEDYLIIPIQRVARYGLLLADYDALAKAYKVITSLAVAMDSAQEKYK